MKYIDILGRKGCSRTASEYCKFLLATNPTTDPYGALLRLDFYQLRAHDYQTYIEFVRKLPLELHSDEPSSSMLIMPNVLLSVGLAKHQLLLEKDSLRAPTHKSMDESILTILDL